MSHPVNKYEPISTQSPQGGIFNSPRQKTWMVWTLVAPGNSIETHWEQYVTFSLRKAIEYAKSKIDSGYPIYNVIVCEIVPIDTTIIPRNW